MLFRMAPFVRESRQMRPEVTGWKLVNDFDRICGRWRLLRVQVAGQNHEDEDKERHVSRRGYDDCGEKSPSRRLVVATKDRSCHALTRPPPRSLHSPPPASPSPSRRFQFAPPSSPPSS